MRSFLFVLVFLASALAASAQPVADPADVGTLDAIINAYYEVVSGPAGQARDWARDSTLHHPDAVLTVVRTGPEGETVIEPSDLAAYHASSGGLSNVGFFEVEDRTVVPPDRRAAWGRGPRVEHL